MKASLSKRVQRIDDPGGWPVACSDLERAINAAPSRLVPTCLIGAQSARACECDPQTRLRHGGHGASVPMKSTAGPAMTTTPEPPRDADGHATVAPDTLQQVAALMGCTVEEARLALLGGAVQRNIDQLRVVRALVLDDAIEPPTLFQPLR